MNSRTLRIQRATAIWLLLIAITAASGWLARGMAVRDDRYLGVAIVALAFVKIRFVILDFMEIRNAPLKMRQACEAWVIILCATIVFIDLQ
jgi:heme/copper-type cytochrome/quinol oxidase subunit 4